MSNNQRQSKDPAIGTTKNRTTRSNSLEQLEIVSTAKMSQAFYSYGKFCVCHPWEVIVAFFTLSICAISIGSRRAIGSLDGRGGHSFPTCTNIPCPSKESVTLGDIVLFTISASLAIFYVHRQFRSLVDLGSKYLIGIATIFTVVSSLVFASGVINLLNRDFSELINSMPLFLLLTQLPKAISLAQFALSSSSRDEVRTNIAKGMAIIGPCLTINTISWTLAIGIGTLPIFSGVKRMEDISYLTCLSFVVNYIIFMTFFPACLSLALELSHTNREVTPVWKMSSLTTAESPFHFESEQTPNPVIQRVKIIMSAGLLLVHLLSRWSTESARAFGSNSNVSNSPQEENNADIFGDTTHSVSKRGFEPLILMIAFLGVIVTKYVLFDDRQDIIAKRNRTISNSSVSSESTNGTSVKSIEVSSKVSNLSTQVTDETSAMAASSQKPLIVVNDNLFLSNNRTAMSRRSPNVSRKRSTGSRPFFIGDGDNSSVSSEDSVELVDAEVQTEESTIAEVIGQFKTRRHGGQERTIEELVTLLNSDDGAKELEDEEVIKLIEYKRLAAYQLEKAVADSERGVRIRRLLLAKNQAATTGTLVRTFDLPYKGYDYDPVLGACCENVIGYTPVPCGFAGPLLLDGKEFYVPMSTTEGCLVASTNRGCRALSLSGGVKSMVTRDAMTRAPVVTLPSGMRAGEVMAWLNQPTNYLIIKEAFDSSSRFARLVSIHTSQAGRDLHIRLAAETGDAMGMNMVSKGAELAMGKLKEIFPDLVVKGISGNTCTDKKPSAMNWILGRGKSVVCEAIIPAQTVRDVLKTDVSSINDLNIRKNLTGSALAGSIGGFNAHAANIVTAIYIATGQDPAQNVGSSNCMTLLEASGKGDLSITCTMPCIEVGTIGGGTILKPQAACLEMLGVKGSCIEEPGRNARQLARIICATVLAGELSLLSATASGDLVKSHMKHNRSNVSINASVVTMPSSVISNDNRSGSNNHLK